VRLEFHNKNDITRCIQTLTVELDEIIVTSGSWLLDHTMKEDTIQNSRIMSYANDSRLSRDCYTTGTRLLDLR
jgi:hypothetical protein